MSGNPSGPSGESRGTGGSSAIGDKSIAHADDQHHQAAAPGNAGRGDHRTVGRKERRETSLIWATWGNTLAVVAIGIAELLLK